MTFISRGGGDFQVPCQRLLSIVLAVTLVFPSFVFGADQEESIVQKWDEVSSLRLNGEYDRAIEILNQIIEEYSNSEEILRHAYNQLVSTLLLKGDEENAGEKAQEAVLIFPDLEADPISFPPRMNEMYAQLRSELYGSLTITKPKECRIFLDDDFKGETPLHLELVRAGEYNLMVTKSGYHDYSESIHVDPNAKLNLEVSMDRQRNKRWWLYRIGPAVLTGVLLAVGLSIAGEEGQPAEEQPLPLPPPPPTQ
ncbi:MAG: PEGA domain-containing protein [Candidatus Latescibacteria bacterium]|nr:PEGA domain-containing protein [Candidatus Latescibacterota bacterium]NIO29083.1 PEGA domain-containing protein [Candidatus Latescibacterota bacterium]NIO56708.1 PEGA domain-containing protein [Candidatus Latescibacterota bacterium]NIT02291.1 PEGA domain-containing protein [Candidatus Latescibacterota bacterium]NIT39176.1 PEGA domain-containing protein [Candidatus Latescibacterota bacterium]